MMSVQVDRKKDQDNKDKKNDKIFISDVRTRSILTDKDYLIDG